MDRVEFLCTVPMLEGLALPDLVKLAALGRADTALNGKRISTEGQPAEELFILKEGTVDLRYELPGRESSGDQALSRLEPGAAWGWSALVAPHVYTLSAYCTSRQCAFLRLQREAMEGLFEANTRIGYIFMRNLATIIGQRFNAAQDELAKQQGFDQVHQW
ncbi:MAG: cyclic nucleotide-binding domain-containing protein [Desulfarculaceae bacterium]|nr:cyclic nucleotide-binding domain-containing protein [Desulfarculaceae bacterium]MCF8072858.1 cyclic nucleotide-binding domain-containing protein [Desulfarculaceae bacterium]MCF8101026.1 cyclic nucleotide-binding domain-containing protein [Desulfarculaceae bacterium]MCF8115587.1 cyclic nucleotide-binding domain-containing protein [Desulfarculaceae bacterium]